MPLNIKDDVVHEQARQLAALTGQSITSAVRDAIEASLTKARAQKPKRDAEYRYQRMDTIAKEFRGLWGDKPALSDDDLYDEDGLPK